MGLKEAWLALRNDKPTPPQGEQAGHGSGITNAYFGDVDARIGTYNPEKLTYTTLRKMQRDPTISAALTLEQYALWAVPIDVVDSTDEVNAFVKAVLDRVWASYVKAATHGVAEGCACFERVYLRDAYRLDEETTREGWGLAKLKDIDPASLAAIDVNGLGDFAGYKLSEPSGAILGADKALHFANDIRFGNHWGTPRLAAAYDAWYLRSLLQKWFGAYMQSFAEPAVEVSFPEGETDGQKNADVAKGMANAFQGRKTSVWHPSSTVDMPGWSIKLIEDTQRQGTAQAFLDGMDMCDKRMMLGLLTPEKVLNGEGGSYSLGETHKDVWLMGLDGTMRDLIAPVQDQLVPDIVRFNFGDAPVPRIEPGGMASDVKDFLGKVFLQMIISGAGSVDFDGIAERLGVPVSEEAPEGLPAEGDPVEDMRKNAAALNADIQRARVELASHV